MKDAVATLDRHKVTTIIKSKQGEITLEKSSKHGFEEIITLHAVISKTTDPYFVGTEFIFEGVTEKDIKLAKDFFLIFSDEQMIEQTKYGQVLILLC